ncbi:T9SS type A sorting domain-containing protein [Tenacibaculum sp. M341]|uniref:T9SS type A sorting domain-containing protein n=1 Tax=Tenacibaculum sp. M341 TaxID=2530339 RepID=UPI0010534D25|nr:T9SS type A sorting domain-containing protein [Tenacibaculum sp. M341]TCI90406.1 T9SS type A sorting domain-containing protein [Tenacibaculum sp. M341]
MFISSTKKYLQTFLILAAFYVNAQIRVGDPGVTFDMNLVNQNKSKYPQIEKWITAGVRGGIPLKENLVIQRTIEEGASIDDINNAIRDVSRMGNKRNTILIKKGTYIVNKKITMKSNVSLIGESRGETIFEMHEDFDNKAFNFERNTRFAGLYNMTIRGSSKWGDSSGFPKFTWNTSNSANDELNGSDNILVFFKESTDCWLDDVNLINAGRDPMRCNAKHNTFRGLIVDGAFSKSGGAQGYFFIQKGYNLITDCQMTHLRHFSLQGGGVEYNVVYDNEIKQEISFHAGDNGNNLIEKNKIVLPEDMSGSRSSASRNPDYFSIMGPWSSQHQNSARDNFLLNNATLELQHNGASPFSRSNKVYHGPLRAKPADHSTNFKIDESKYPTPSGNTLYPVIVSSPTTVATKDLEPYFMILKNNQQFNIGDHMVVTVDASAKVKEVSLFFDDTLISTQNSTPYSWNKNSEFLGDLEEGTHELKAVIKGMDDETKTITITIQVGMSDTLSTEDVIVEDESALTIFPNPFINQITIKNAEQNDKVRIYSIEGKLVQEDTVNASKTFILNSEFKSGVYLVAHKKNIYKLIKK